MQRRPSRSSISNGDWEEPPKQQSHKGQSMNRETRSRSVSSQPIEGGFPSTSRTIRHKSGVDSELFTRETNGPHAAFQGGVTRLDSRSHLRGQLGFPSVEYQSDSRRSPIRQDSSLPEEQRHSPPREVHHSPQKLASEQDIGRIDASRGRSPWTNTRNAEKNQKTLEEVRNSILFNTPISCILVFELLRLDTTTDKHVICLLPLSTNLCEDAHHTTTLSMC